MYPNTNTQIVEFDYSELNHRPNIGQPFSKDGYTGDCVAIQKEGNTCYVYMEVKHDANSL